IRHHLRLPRQSWNGCDPKLRVFTRDPRGETAPRLKPYTSLRENPRHGHGSAPGIARCQEAFREFAGVGTALAGTTSVVGVTTVAGETMVMGGPWETFRGRALQRHARGRSKALIIP